MPTAWQWVEASQVQVQADSWHRQAVGLSGSGSCAGRQEELCQAECLGNALLSGNISVAGLTALVCPKAGGRL